MSKTSLGITQMDATAMESWQLQKKKKIGQLSEAPENHSQLHYWATASLMSSSNCSSMAAIIACV